MCRVLVPEELVEQGLESRFQVRPHGWQRRQRLVQRAELVFGRHGVHHGVARIAGNAVSHLQILPNPLLQLVTLVAQQRLSRPAIHQRQVGGQFVEALPGQDVVQHHQATQVMLRLGAEERRHPHQRLRIVAPIVGQTCQVVGGCELRVVEREVDNHRPGTRAPAQLFVRHLADVLEQHLDFALRPAPQHRVGGEQVVGIGHAKLLEQHLAHAASAVAGVVAGGCRATHDGLDVHAGDLDRNQGVGIVGDLDLADVGRPLLALAQHVLGFATGDGRADRAVVQRSQALRRQGLQRIDFRHQSAQQQCLDQARIVA